jgi:uncharacterized protein YegJ (DUF2314 family)
MKFNPLISVLAFTGVFSTAQAQSLVDRAASDEIAYMASEEPAMRLAFERASATLDDFLLKAQSPVEGTSKYALKVAVSDGRNTEYFWVNRFTGSGDTFSGHLGNEPRMVKKYKFDEKFSFRRAQVVDWTYFDQRTASMVGNFTACALLTKESAANAEAFKRRYGFRCE